MDSSNHNSSPVTETEPESLADLIRELATSPAWHSFFRQVEEWIKAAQLELEASSSWDEHNVTKGGILVLRLIQSWKSQLVSELRELKTIADSDVGE